VRESLWIQNTPQRLTGIARDVRYAFRTLSRTPGFTIIAVAVMALCIGAATSLFTIVRSVLLRPLPFRDPDQLVMVYQHHRGPGDNQDSRYTPVAAADFYDWRSRTRGFEDMAVITYGGYNLSGERSELPESVNAVAASWNLLPLLGVQPAFGSVFTEPEDRRGSTVVMLTWSVFERRFAGDPRIVGRQIHLNGTPFTVVGVLPSWFTYPNASIQLWVPHQAFATPELLEHHDWHQSQVVARLRPDVSQASALEQVRALQYQLHLQYPHDPVSDDVIPRSLNEDLAGNVKKPLNLMLSAVGCMMLIGCLNISNLLVARGGARQKEMAIRSALGAQRAILIREQLTESVLICAAGGLLGIFLSVLATRLLAHAWKKPAHRAEHLHRRICDCICMRTHVRSGAGCRVATRALHNEQNDVRGPTNFPSYGSKQHFAHNAEKDAVDVGDRNHGGFADRCRTAGQEFSASALDGCGLCYPKHADAVLRGARKEIRNAGEGERIQ
jgi:predicted permease